METAQVAASDVIEDRRSVGDRPELSIGNIAGRITIRVGADGEIAFTARKRGSERARANTRIEVEQEEDRVSIRTRTEQGMDLLHLGRSLSAVEYDVTVPVHCRINVKGVSASVDLAGVHAPVQVETVSGAIVLDDLEGILSVNTVSGSLRANNLRGELKTRGTSGSAEVRSSRLDGFSLHTVSGGLTVESPLLPGRFYRGHSVSGSLMLRVPPETGATITLRSVSGRVHVDGLATQVIKAGPKGWQGRLGDGSATVEMHSVSGGVRVEGTGESDGIPAAGADGDNRESSGVQNRNEILRALQAGDLTVDEAMARLDYLGR